MAKLNRITQHASGDHWRIRRTITMVPTEGLESAALFIKTELNAPDNLALITKSITTTFISGIGGIDDTGEGDRTGSFTFELTPTETNSLLSGRSYAYKIVVRTPSGIVNTPEKGTIIPQ